MLEVTVIEQLIILEFLTAVSPPFTEGYQEEYSSIRRGSISKSSTFLYGTINGHLFSLLFH